MAGRAKTRQRLGIKKGSGVSVKQAKRGAVPGACPGPWGGVLCAGCMDSVGMRGICGAKVSRFDADAYHRQAIRG